MRTTQLLPSRWRTAQWALCSLTCTHAAGCNVETEIISTHGTLRIANVGAKNLLNIVDEHGSARSIIRTS